MPLVPSPSCCGRKALRPFIVAGNCCRCVDDDQGAPQPAAEGQAAAEEQAVARYFEQRRGRFQLKKLLCDSDREGGAGRT